MDTERRDEVVDFLRRWLPRTALGAYRDLILRDPEAWMEHPHFRDGIIVRYALRGNGIDERFLGAESLEECWPELVWRAVMIENGERELR